MARPWLVSLDLRPLISLSRRFYEGIQREALYLTFCLSQAVNHFDFCHAIKPHKIVFNYILEKLGTCNACSNPWQGQHLQYNSGF